MWRPTPRGPCATSASARAGVRCRRQLPRLSRRRPRRERAEAGRADADAGARGRALAFGGGRRESGLRSAVRVVCDSEGWDSGRYYRLEEASGALRFQYGWCVNEPAVDRFLERSRVVWQFGAACRATCSATSARRRSPQPKTRPARRADLRRHVGTQDHRRARFLRRIGARARPEAAAGGAGHRQPCRPVPAAQADRAIAARERSALPQPDRDVVRLLLGNRSAAPGDEHRGRHELFCRDHRARRHRQDAVGYPGAESRRGTMGEHQQAWTATFRSATSSSPRAMPDGVTRYSRWPASRGSLATGRSSGIAALAATSLRRAHARADRSARLQRSAHRACQPHQPHPALEQAVERARRHGARLAGAFIDLDGFKQINDTYGHDAGDQFLVEMARRLRSKLRRPISSRGSAATSSSWSSRKSRTPLPSKASTASCWMTHCGLMRCLAALKRGCPRASVSACFRRRRGCGHPHKARRRGDVRGQGGRQESLLLFLVAEQRAAFPDNNALSA